MLKAIIIDKDKVSIDNNARLLGDIEGIIYLGAFEKFEDIKEKIDEINLILFDINSNNADLILNEVKKLDGKNIKFIALSYEMNSQLMAKTLGENVSDFLLKPLIKPILEACIKKFVNEDENKSNPSKIITIYSNKGGVGKTSLAVNLGFEISKKIPDKKVCLLDFSFNNEDIGAFLNIETKSNINFILSRINSLDENALLALLNRYENSNLYLFNYSNNSNNLSKPSIQIINQILGFLKNIFSYIIIDTNSMVDEININILNNSDLILLLAMENLVSIRNCQKCYELFDNIGYDNDKIKLIINRHIENSDITINDIEKTVDAKVWAKIPNNYLTLIDAINLAHPVGKINPNSNIAKAYKEIASKTMDIDFSNQKKTNYNHGIFNLLKKMGE